jgi:ABC-type transporter Mla subunit MlaD
VFAVIGVIAIGVVLLWLVGLPGEEDTEELAGFVTANWDEVRDLIDHH